jgi:hypothetical protein
VVVPVARWFALGAVVALLCGCGGRTPAMQAQAINLRTADLPGSSAGVLIRQPASQGPLLASTERCDGGLPGPRGIVGYSSRRLYVPPSKAPSPGVTTLRQVSTFIRS